LHAFPDACHCGLDRVRSLHLTLTGDRNIDVAELQTLGLFGALSDEILGKLAERLGVTDVAEHDIVFEEGQRGRAMYVVLDGELELLKKSRRHRPVPVATLGKGDWFGEVALLDVTPRAVTARALTDVRLLVITSSDLDALYRENLKAYALLVMNLARQLSRKLRFAEAVLANTITSVMDHDVDEEAP
jgi:CRP-like cAMP-binding protein